MSQRTIRYQFTSVEEVGSISVMAGRQHVPLFDEAQGYGFVQYTNAMPPREVHIDSIAADRSGVHITESEFDVAAGSMPDHFNHYGMAFRIAIQPGAYHIRVITTSEAAHTMVSVSGMYAERLLHTGTWDAAGRVPIQYPATYSGREWIYTYVNGRPYIDIEVEPKLCDVPVGLERVEITPLVPRVREEKELPKILLLGDSTVKSYVFEEAPMSGWGQVFDRLFDRNRVQIINYSQGGRSFKNAYNEGRFNDLLLSGNIGDYVFIQFGHNDEREDEWTRYGRGSTEDGYADWLQQVYIPAIQARGMTPVLITPTSRVKGDAELGHLYTNSFQNRKFPDVLKSVGKQLDIMVIDLNEASVAYFNDIGVEATTAIHMAIEVGETPGKTNDGSLANGHPANKVDGTHYKEALAKQFARLIVSEIVVLGDQGDRIASAIMEFIPEEIHAAVRTNEWSKVYPEIAKDIESGSGAYYRNQLEKMIQLGVIDKDENGYVRPDEIMSVDTFVSAVSKLLHIPHKAISEYGPGLLTREIMAAVLYDAYQAKFTNKPVYMTDYNKRTVKPGDSGYDPNLDHEAYGVMYDPLVPFEQLTDITEIDPVISDKVRQAYGLGLIRAENGIRRGRMENGTLLEPKLQVTRGNGSKALYFIWIMSQPIKLESHSLA